MATSPLSIVSSQPLPPQGQAQQGQQPSQNPQGDSGLSIVGSEPLPQGPASKAVTAQITSGVNQGAGFVRGAYEGLRNVAKVGAKLNPVYQLANEATGGKIGNALHAGAQKLDSMIPEAPDTPGAGFAKWAGKSVPFMAMPELGEGWVAKSIYNSVVGALSGAGDTGTVSGAATGAIGGAVMTGVNKLFSRYARTLYAKALQPTRLDTKQITASKLLNGGPGDLVNRGIWGMSHESILNQLKPEIAEYGQKIEGIIKQLDSRGYYNLSQIIDGLQDKAVQPVNRFAPNGPRVVGSSLNNKDLVGSFMKTGKDIAGSDVVQTRLQVLQDFVDNLRKHDPTGGAYSLNRVRPSTLQFIKGTLQNAAYGDKLTPNLKNVAAKFASEVSDVARDVINHSSQHLSSGPSPSLPTDSYIQDVMQNYHILRAAADTWAATAQRKVGQQGLMNHLDGMIGSLLLKSHPVVGMAAAVASRTDGVRTGGAVLLNKAAQHSAQGSALAGQVAAELWQKSKHSDDNETPGYPNQ